MRPTRVLGALVAIAALFAAQSCTVKQQNESQDLVGPSSFITPPAPAPPTAQFTFNPTAPAVGSPVAFDGRGSCPEAGFTGGCVTSDHVISQYNWDFGDGTTGSGSTVSHAYRTLGSFNVSLTVVSDRGLASTASKSVSVGVGGTPPAAAFVFSPTNPTIGQSVSFNASQSRSGSNGIASYSWDFGDGGKGSGINPTHSWNTAGTFNVLLIVTDEAGQIATATQSVPVQSNPTTPLPTADFVFSPTSGTTGQAVQFNASQSRAATGHSIVSYAWNFGDAATGSGATPAHSFSAANTYTVVLVVTDDLGQTGTATKTVPVTSNSGTPPPTADFVFSPTGPIVSQAVSFNAALSKPATGRTISSYAWNFGDGTPAGSGVNPSHTFTTAATFSVVLTVTDDIGQSATTSKTVSVTSTPTDPPSASFVFSPGSPQVNSAVLFDATQSTAAQGHTLGYAWNFGDNGTGTGITPSHTFTNAGSYSVVLKVTDNTNLQTATTTKIVIVTTNSNNPPPTATFVFSPGSPAANQPVLFNASQSSATAGHTITTYAWDFGDGSTGTGVTPPGHSFATAGTYNVVLIVTDDLGQTGNTSKPVTVSATSSSPPPTAAFTFSPSSPALGETVFFDARNSAAAAGHTIVSYKWTFGDSTGTVTAATPTGTTHVYNAPPGAGTYTVTLVVTDDVLPTGNTSTTSQTITVGNPPAPTAKFTVSPLNPVVDQAVIFDAATSTTAQGQTITKYEWNFGDGTPITTCPGSVDCGPTNRTISHKFQTAQNFTVNLVVTDSANRIGSTSGPVTVATADPTARLSLTKAGLLNIIADGSASTATGTSTIATYSFNWGDGTGSTTGSSSSQPHTYGASGTYTVVLTVTDNHVPGRSSTTSQTITVP